MLEGHEPGIGGGIGGGQSPDERRVSIYIESSTPEAHLTKALASGATLIMPVTTITPDTTIAMFLDPAGNTVGILKANPRRPSAAQAARAASGGTRRRSATRKKATAKRKTAKKSARKTTARKRTKRR